MYCCLENHILKPFFLNLDYMQTGLHEITKVQSSEDSQALGGLSKPTKEISENKADNNINDDEEDDYEE